MKNIILQHWAGDLNELVERSTANISKYADSIGADYQFLRGHVFHPDLAVQSQKIYMLDEVFDEYDMVVMLDADMFVRKGMTENVFTDVEGIGRHTEIQQTLIQGLLRRFPSLGNPKFPYWGGAIYRLTKPIRQQLRTQIDFEELIQFNKAYQDEGIMHRLAVRANMRSPQYLPGNNRWDCGNYERGVEQSALIHIRTKIGPKGPKRPKFENYKNLVKRGLIEA